MHIVYVYSLLKAIQQIKLELSAVPEGEQTREDRSVLDFLRRRGSSFLLVSAVAACSEIYLNRAIPDLFRLSFGAPTSPAVGAEYWLPLVKTLLPFVPRLASVFTSGGGLAGREAVKAAIEDFRQIVASTKLANASVFNEFKMHVVVA